MTALAWGAKVDENFRERVRFIAGELGADPSHLMSCMAFETGRTFSPSVRNPSSSATGLIQFMESTAQGLGTSTAELASMTALEQLEYVRKYFLPYAGKLTSLADCYAAVIWPRAVGKPDDYVVFGAGSTAYEHNQALDFDKSGAVTKGECAAVVERYLAEGLRQENATEWEGETQPEQPMAETTSGFQWSDLLKMAGPIAAAFNPIAGLVVSAFSPLLQEKIGKELSRHTDSTTAQSVAANLTSVIAKVATRETGELDADEAMLRLRKDPALVAKAEAAVTNRLQELAPFIDKMEALETKERADTLAGQDAAALRAKNEAWDMSRTLVYASLAMVMLVVVFFGAVALIQLLRTGAIATEVWAALTGVSGTLLGIMGTIFAYRFSSTQQSSAKNAIIGELARR
jgi:hypothetical protein